MQTYQTWIHCVSTCLYEHGGYAPSTCNLNPRSQTTSVLLHHRRLKACNCDSMILTLHVSESIPVPVDGDRDTRLIEQDTGAFDAALQLAVVYYSQPTDMEAHAWTLHNWGMHWLLTLE